MKQNLDSEMLTNVNKSEVNQERSCSRTKKVLRGIKRVPILLLNNPLKDLNQMGLGKYEIVMVECMHDIANHIDNILEELPNHLKGEERPNLLKCWKHTKQKKKENGVVIRAKYYCN